MMMMNMKFTKSSSCKSGGGGVVLSLSLSRILLVLLVLLTGHDTALFATNNNVLVASAASFLTTKSLSPTTFYSCSYHQALACSPTTSKRRRTGTRTRSSSRRNLAALKNDDDTDDDVTTRATTSTTAAAAATIASSPRECVFQGMQAFRRGNVAESIQLFDLAERLSSSSSSGNRASSLTPFLWRRGISYYYANDFVNARRQFRTDVAVNPSDVEEIVWEIASQLRIQPDTFPVPDALSLPPGKQDSRRIMGTVYQLFKGRATEQDLAMAGLLDPKRNNPRPLEEFYALFYLALYNEAREGANSSKALHYMRQALHTPYAKANNVSGEGGDYMVAVARVHCQLRGGLGL